MKISNITFRNSINIYNTNNKNKNHQYFQKANINEKFDSLFISKKRLSNISFNGIPDKLKEVGIIYPKHIEYPGDFISAVSSFECFDENQKVEYIQKVFESLSKVPEVAELQLEFCANWAHAELGYADKIGNLSSDLKTAKKQLDAIVDKREVFFKEYRSYFGNEYVRDYVRNYPKRGKFDPSNIAVLINCEYFRIISPSLVTGPYPVAKELKKLKQLGVTGILSVVNEPVEERTLECQKAGLKFLNFKISNILASIDDLGNRISPEEIAKKIKEFIDFINSNNVYMHCKLGRDRTGNAIALNNRYNPKQNFTVEMVMFNSDSDNISVDGLTPELIKKYGLRAEPDLQGLWKARDEADQYSKSFSRDDIRVFFGHLF